MATKELTTGSPLKLIILFMVPIFLGNLFQQVYSLVDTLIVGRTIGIKALAAVGATGPMIFLIISFIFASTQGFAVVTAQKFGARDYNLLRKSVTAGFILSFILTIIMTLISAPFTEYMLGVVIKAYREFESRVTIITDENLTKSDRIREIIHRNIGMITKTELINMCPDISSTTVQRTLSELVKEGTIKKIGGGRYTKYIWNEET